MARSSPMWWPWVQRNLDARGWRPADLAHAIMDQPGGGPDESVIGRWRSRGAAPTRKSVLAVATAFQRKPREALIAAGLVTAEDLDSPWPDPLHIDLTAVPDDVLADEVTARLVRRRNAHSRTGRQPVANGPSRTAITTTGSGSSRHTVPTGTTTTPPPSGEDEGVGQGTAHCA